MFMKSTGIVRNIDELGRLVIPKEMRKTLEIQCNDPVEISVDGDSIILTKYKSRCVFCDAEENLILFRGKKLCPMCLRALRTTL
ncbi:MAG: AbrB/MazE/SpoVT family DNA-binding domain-containing protein [Clostridia bacterium]|nr:AbrB/MazE/SpoVT family DNA-binding domain-containing protein [Clostridia bacterium]